MKSKVEEWCDMQ